MGSVRFLAEYTRIVSTPVAVVVAEEFIVESILIEEILVGGGV